MLATTWDAYTDDIIAESKSFFSSIDAADKRLHAELLATVRHISVDEYPPERVAEILKRAKETDTYCRELIKTDLERSLFNV